MAQADSNSQAASVPYVPFPSLQTALDHLASNGIPSVIEPRVFPSMSGGLVSHLLLTLRFFGAVNADGTHTKVLEQLVDVKTRKQTLAALIPKAYVSLFQRLDLSKASPKQLDDALAEQNVTGATRRKARSFLIKSAKFAGLPVSTYLTKRTRASGPRKSTKSANTCKSDSTNGTGVMVPEVPADSQSQRTVRLPDSGGTITLGVTLDPLKLRGRDREFFYRLVDMLDDFERDSSAKANGGD